MRWVHFLGVLVILFPLLGCEKVEQPAFTDTPIIEGYLQPGKPFMLKISRQTAFSSDVPYASDDINALSIEVERNEVSYTLSPNGNGVYSDSSLIVEADDQFVLSFSFNGQAVSAYTYIPSKPSQFSQSAVSISVDRVEEGTFGPPSAETDPIEMTWDNPDHSYYLLLVENVESILDPIRDFGDNEPPTNIFRKQPTSLGSEEIGAREFQYFGTHRIIIYHVLPDYAALYNSESTSSQNLSNPSSSIANGYGIFTGLNADTLWVEVLEN